MTVSVRKFVTRCETPRRLGLGHARIDRIAREQFAPACARQLAAQRTLLPHLVRIRRLHVRLTLSAAQIQENRAASAWADAFLRALLESLAGSTAEIVCAENRTEWLARAIVHLLDGDFAQRWEYEEFRELFCLGPSAACFALFEREPDQMLAIFTVLEKQGKLERMLNLFDALALERFFLLAENVCSSRSVAPLSLDDLLELGRLMIGLRAPVPGRKAALRLLALLALNSAAGTWTPARITDALAVLVALLRISGSARLEETRRNSAASLSAEKALSPAVLQLLEEINAFVEKGAVSSRLAELEDLLTKLRPLAPDVESAGRGKDVRWISSDCAGLFLLAGVLEKMRWPERFHRSSLDPRARACFRTGIALAALDRMAEPIERIEPTVALFAGWPNEPDRAAFAHFCAAGSPAERLQLLRECCGADFKTNPTDTETWAGTFDALAACLLSQFAKRVRGFRQASRKFVSVNFLKVPGRICLEEKRLLVVLAPNPFHVALHLSAADEPMESIPWLGYRRLEFQLEGL